MAKFFTDKIILLLGITIITTLLLFPSVKLGASIPLFEIVDFLMPLVALAVFVRRKEIELKNFFKIITLFGGFILLTIMVNGRWGQIRDYFEVYKMIKLGLIAALFSLLDITAVLRYCLKPVFVLLVVANLLHYFNLFNFNVFLEAFYNGKNRYMIFGLDSLGNLTYKRMLGLVTNPNDNAIIFAIFAAIFVPKKIKSQEVIWFSVALIMIFLCQSRTSLLAIFPFILFQVFAYGKEWKKSVVLIGLTVVSFAMAYGITKSTINIVSAPSYNEEVASQYDYGAPEVTYLESIAHGQFLQGSSMNGRYEIWMHLWGMIKEKPIFGHGPYKEYFYENEIYMENELISMTWRYGFIGLFIFLFLQFYLIKLGYQNRHLIFGNALVLMILWISVSEMTNVPLSNRTVIVLYGMVIGLLVSERRKYLKKSGLRD